MRTSAPSKIPDQVRLYVGAATADPEHLHSSCGTAATFKFFGFTVGRRARSSIAGQRATSPTYGNPRTTGHRRPDRRGPGCLHLCMGQRVLGVDLGGKYKRPFQGRGERSRAGQLGLATLATDKAYTSTTNQGIGLPPGRQNEQRTTMPLLPNPLRMFSYARGGGVSRVAKGADCKSAGLRLRRFESYLPHQTRCGLAQW